MSLPVPDPSLPIPDRPLLEADALPDPLSQFAAWFAEALVAVRMPEAMALATVDPAGRPSVRMVLCKGWDRSGFTFYPNHQSRKGIELGANPMASLLFYWEPLGRQVRIEGTAARVDTAEADRYFASRPRGAQLGAQASAQSRPVADRGALERAVARADAELGPAAVTRPQWWGGYRLRATSFEFWQNRQNRLHDRLRYLPDGEGWRIDRLQP